MGHAWLVLTLNCFIASKEIWVDAVGWGDLLLGVVIGAVKPPNPMLMERRIPISSFQPPNFGNRKYFDDSIRIGEEIVSVMRPDEDTCFKICSEYVLSSLMSHLTNRGFNVQGVDDTGEVRKVVERAYLRWCVEEGVPEEMLREKRRFWTFLDWVAENPRLREGLVKTGWASWERKWREEIYRRHPVFEAK